jgi:hypothetical protein
MQTSQTLNLVRYDGRTVQELFLGHNDVTTTMVLRTC